VSCVCVCVCVSLCLSPSFSLSVSLSPPHSFSPFLDKSKELCII
jgi:hypothetical protein